MPRIIINDIDEALMHRLCLLAHEHGQSLDCEALEILRDKAYSTPPPEYRPSKSLADDIRKLVAPFGGVDLDIPPRGLPADSNDER